MSEEFEFPKLHDPQKTEQVPVPESLKEPELVKPEKENQPSLQGDVAPVPHPVLEKSQLSDKLREWFINHKPAGLAIGFVLVAGLMWGISQWRGSGPTEDDVATSNVPDEIPVNVVEVRFGRFQDKIEAVGTLKGEAEIELRFEVEGKIEEFRFEEGARVSKGQVIARLSDRDAQLKVKRAKTEVVQTRKLFELGGVSRTKLDEVELNLEVAQTELDKTRIVAPRDGILGDKGADIGEFVNPQRKVAKLVSIRSVVVEIGVIEKQVDKIFPGQKILVSVDAYPGTIFEGTIDTISPVVDESKMFSIRAKIPNEDSLLLPGMFARARIITKEIDDAMTVPNDSLVKTTGGFQVFVVNADNIANPIDVEVGYISTENTQINAGLSAGDIIVVHKPPELKAGSKVKVIDAPQ